MISKLLYRAYERRLESQVRRGPIPRHVGVVLDGNRRFAQKTGAGGPEAGHRIGAETARDLIGWCDDLQIPVVTLWALSIDNLRRDPTEIGAITSLIEEKAHALAAAQAESRVPRRIRAVGRLEVLPESTRRTIAEVEAMTAANGPFEVVLAVAYGGREEITDAVRRLIADRLRAGDSLEGVAARLQPDEIGEYLYAADIPDPDLIIRTSGEVRLSGFLLWQSAYSEYYFCDVFWPEFRRIDFLRAIRSYASRERRLGR